MKLLSLFLLFIIASCARDYPKAENAFDAGREFIDASLKGDFPKAQAYMLADEANNKEFEMMKEAYRNRSNDEKQQYHNASITVLEEDTISDSVHIINYQNSFDKIARKLKVVKGNNGWLVNLSYTANGNL